MSETVPTAPSPVIVNLAVEQDASGAVSIFSQVGPDITQEVIVSKHMPLAATLYGGDASGSALFQFQGQGNDLAAKVASGFVAGATTALTDELHNCLCAPDASGVVLDAVDAAPFDASKYASESNYREFANLGEMALAYYAHHLFGHVQATAAIDNDTTIISTFNGKATGAAVPSGLATKIVSMSDEAALAVVKQVLGQDSSRAEMVDNDLSSPDSWQNLKFIAGDKIYVTVRIQRPALTIAQDAAQLGADATTSATRVPETTSYMFQITLA